MSQQGESHQKRLPGKGMTPNTQEQSFCAKHSLGTNPATAHQSDEVSTETFFFKVLVKHGVYYQRLGRGGSLFFQGMGQGYEWTKFRSPSSPGGPLPSFTCSRVTVLDSQSSLLHWLPEACQNDPGPTEEKIETNVSRKESWQDYPHKTGPPLSGDHTGSCLSSHTPHERPSSSL